MHRAAGIGEAAFVDVIQGMLRSMARRRRTGRNGGANLSSARGRDRTLTVSEGLNRSFKLPT